MQHLNDKATAIFRKLTDGLRKVGDHQQWNNDSSSFMAACVEIIGRTGLGPLVSVAHYYEQNGDMMRDPDVVFVIGADQHVYPITSGRTAWGPIWNLPLWRTDNGRSARKCRPTFAVFATSGCTTSNFNRILGGNDVSDNDGFFQDRPCCPREKASDTATTRRIVEAEGSH